MEGFKVFFNQGLQDHASFADRVLASKPFEPSGRHPPGYHSISFGQFDRSSIDALFCCDGAWDKVSHIAAAAWVADIFSSEFQIEDSLLFRASSALQVEAQACRLCLQ